MSRLGNLQNMLDQGQDSPLLRFSLGVECLEAGQSQLAITHLRQALRLDPDYSAAWKLLGKAHGEAGNRTQAAASWRSGIEVARARGDEQAVREMTVFMRRLEKDHDAD